MNDSFKFRKNLVRGSKSNCLIKVNLEKNKILKSRIIFWIRINKKKGKK